MEASLPVIPPFQEVIDPSCVAVAEGRHIDPDPHPPEDVLIDVDCDPP